MNIAPEPYKANEIWMHEFYENLNVVSTTNPMMIIRGKQVNFGVGQVNAVYRPPNVDMRQFHARAYEPRSWMDNILYPGKEVP